MTQSSGRDGPENRRWSLAVALRVAAVALVLQAILQRCAGSITSLSMPLRTAIYLSIVVLGVAQLVSLSIIRASGGCDPKSDECAVLNHAPCG